MELDLLQNNTATLVASLAYDYGQIENPDDRAAMQAAALDIKPRLKRVVGDIVATGKALLGVQHVCPYGKWEEWLGAEFDLSVRMAQHWMNLAESEVGKNENFSLLPLSALYQLAAPSTPEAAVVAVEEKIAKGERPKLAEVKATIAEHKPRPAPPPQPQRVADVVAQVMGGQGEGKPSGPVDVSDTGEEWQRLQKAHTTLSSARIGLENVLDIFKDYGYDLELEYILKQMYKLRENIKLMKPEDKL